MSKLPLSLTAVPVAVLLAAVPGYAALAPSASARVAAAFSAAGPAGLGAWTIGPELPWAPAVRGRAVFTQGLDPLVPRALWDSAKPISPAVAQWLSARVPGLDTSKVREASYDQVAAVVAEAARRGDSILDLFTDEGLRGDVAYYLSADTMARLYRDFNLQASLQASGQTTDGQPYHMDGLVMGRGSVSILYNLDGFEFDHDGKTYRASARVVQTIQGAGVLGISGLWVHVWPFTPEIQRLTKLGGGRMRVDTNKGSRDMDDKPILRR